MELNRFRGCLLGLACGDAVGTTLEFQARGSFTEINDMIGGGPFDLEPGEWTDDTSMALCLATSLLECGGSNPQDQMDRYWRWYREGYLSSNGRCFDIGITISSALMEYYRTGNPIAGPTHTRSAGNGSIMRLAPVVLFYYPDLEQAKRYAAESSRTTHGTEECLDACRLLTTVLFHLLHGHSKETLWRELKGFEGAANIQHIAEGSYLEKSREEIRGSGYVVDCLEAALWCFNQTENFREAVLAATNLGDDADTTAAVCGQMAGACYGEDGIPAEWLDKLVMRESIRGMADRLYEATP